MKNWLLCSLLCLISSAYSQTILIFDLENGTLDSIVSFPIDTSLTSAQTGYFEGNYSVNVAPLTATFPTTNTFPQSQFALKRKVALDYSVDDFPIRAATKIFSVEDEEMIGRCSGSMISRKHVLTAAHCHMDFLTNDLSQDTFLVSPAFDNGSAHSEFGYIGVSKIYVVRDWGLSGDDFAILELKEWIGYQTGWIGIGFEEDSATHVDRMHYKFSYPSVYEPAIDSTVYNGDTLFYNYGKINYLVDNFLGVAGGSGIPGESGSPLIHIENDQTYTVYGVLSLSSNLSHPRINSWFYHAFFSIISSDLNVGEPIEPYSGIVYPNPATNVMNIEGFNSMKVQKIQNSIGQEINTWQQDGAQISIDQLTPGIYFLFVETEVGMVSLRFVKQ